jgi:hypothetical protein
MVDAGATTGWPAASAALTLGDTSTRDDGTARLSHRRPVAGDATPALPGPG